MTPEKLLFDLSAEDRMLDALALLRAARAQLVATSNAVHAGDIELVARLKDMPKDLRIALQNVIHEEEHLEKTHKLYAARGRGDAQLDLAAARLEIGRRLALLRAARPD